MPTPHPSAPYPYYHDGASFQHPPVLAGIQAEQELLRVGVTTNPKYVAWAQRVAVDGNLDMLVRYRMNMYVGPPVWGHHAYLGRLTVTADSVTLTKIDLPIHPDLIPQ